MSVVIETLVICDGCGENGWGDGRDETAKAQRADNRAEGWVTRGSKDFYPKCKSNQADAGDQQMVNGQT